MKFSLLLSCYTQKKSLLKKFCRKRGLETSSGPFVFLNELVQQLLENEIFETC